jgi:poly-gamma-glutamate synthase PgsB/CapB
MLGHGLVSKTTGCEAMFIHANALGEPLEIPLFRPYDKATIWEQRNLVRLASRMDPSVFLWECMALNPAYVDVLQRQWTRDDLATITNAYPDHEDIQGPAGYNVAETISGFVPTDSHLISTEQVMRPYVTESCKRANTSFRGVGWLESGLITSDVLERFPYKEHPDNIALVAALGDELGCSYEFCLKAMADYLVPDLGVLKTHPVAQVRSREIEFTNGMSANERFGCMGNWRRLGFDRQDPWDDPAIWITGVVNNRADRVPRSKVFAKIIVEDIQADRFFLIGSNLQGLRGFIEESWDELATTLTLRDKTAKWSVDFAQTTLRQTARKFRQPAEPAHIQAKLEQMATVLNSSLSDEKLLDPPSVAGNWNEPDKVGQQLKAAGLEKELVDSVLKHQRQWLAALDEYQQLEKLVTESSSAHADSIEQKFVSTLRTWYFRKLVVIEDFDATGEEVVATIVNETPPGFLNRCMGLQNIKGTGLDFVYRFQAWDVCHQACCLAMGNQVQKMEKGLQLLVSMPVIGQLCQSKIREVIRYAKANSVYRRPELQALLDQLEKNLETDSGEMATTETETQRPSNNGKKLISDLNAWMIECAEQFLDVHDSIRRRNTADLIYADLANERIGRQRAIIELRDVNKRQKGGWLAASLRKNK